MPQVQGISMHGGRNVPQTQGILMHRGVNVASYSGQTYAQGGECCLIFGADLCTGCIDVPEI